MLTITLSAPISFLESYRDLLMAITASGDLTVWLVFNLFFFGILLNSSVLRNVRIQKAISPPTSVLPLLSQPNAHITSVGLRGNGAPIISLSTGVAHSYDSSLLAWVRVSENWWADGSDAWSNRQRSTSNAIPRGIIAILESSLGELEVAPPPNKETPQWWIAAKTLGHLEQRMGAARLLDSQSEFKNSLLIYAKKLAEEGFRGKAEELVKELYGPVYW